MRHLPVAALAALVAVLGAPASGIAADRSLAFQVDAAHSGAVAAPAAGALPASVRWVRPLGSPYSSFEASISYPIVADGKIFVTVRTGEAYGTDLVALDQATGAPIWSHTMQHTYYWSNASYEDGRVFVLHYDGMLQALSGSNGAVLWSRQFGSASSPPTTHNGVVYVSTSGTLSAVRASDGHLLWSRQVSGGDHSSPAVDGTRVYVSYSCPNVYAFERLSGALAWHHSPGCSGGGGKTPVLHGGRLYVRDLADGLVFDASNGNLQGGFTGAPPPAFSGGMSVFLSEGTLTAVDLATGAQRWSFRGGDGVSSAPLIVGGYVYVGAMSGDLYALELGTGAVAWSGDVGASMPPPDEHNVSAPTTGMGAGDGLLVVPASGRLIALTLGSPPPGGGAIPPGGRQRQGVRLTLRARPRQVALGRRVRLFGRLSRRQRPLAGRRVTLQGDVHPFGDGWRRMARARTNRRGRFSFVGPPRRNTRFRVRSARPRAASRRVTVYANYGGFVRVRQRNGRLRMALVIVAPRWAPPPSGRPVFFYVARRGQTDMQQVARATMRRVGRGRYAARAGARARRLRRGDLVWACWPEPQPDGLGRRHPLDQRCGEPLLPAPTPAAAASRRTRASALAGSGLARASVARTSELRGWDSNPQPSP